MERKINKSIVALLLIILGVFSIMVSMAEIEKYARSKAGQWAYNFGFGYQCVAFIDGINRDLGLGLDCYCRGNPGDGQGGAKWLSVNALPSGWEKVQGDRNNDENAKKIWNTLPNGAIVIFWENGNAYGHVAIKTNEWGASDDTIQQNAGAGAGAYGTEARYLSCGKFCEQGLFGFECAWVLKGTAGKSSGATPAKNNKNASKPNPIIKSAFDLETAIKNFTKFLEDIQDNIDGTLYPMSEQFLTNEIFKLTKGQNTLTIQLDDEFLPKLAETFLSSLKLLAKNANGSGNKVSNVDQKGKRDNKNVNVSGSEGSVEDRVKLITKMCKAYEPNANAYGIAGLIGNFEAESNLDPTNFEAKYIGAHIKEPKKGDKITAENLYGSWAKFRSLYTTIGLDEGSYLIEGEHWIGGGLAQWTGGRTIKLYKYAEHKNVSMWTVKTQMDFAFSEEYEGSNVQQLRLCLKNSESVREGVDNAFTYYERAGDYGSLGKRYASAEKWYPLVLKTLKEG